MSHEAPSPPQPQVEVSIVIVNWNSAAYVQACLASIASTATGIAHEVIVVDSASFDGCGEMVAARYPQVRFIQCERNIGFGQASNAGARAATGRFLLLLNPDTQVLGDAIERLRDHCATLPRAGVVGCRLLNTDGSLQATCVQPYPTIASQVLNLRLLQRLLPRSPAWLTAASYREASQPVAVDVIVGACMVVERKVFEQVGGFSDEYFMYAEDVDLCDRLRRRGLLCYYVPDVKIVHHGGGTTHYSAFSAVMMRESLHRWFSKTRGESYARRYRVALAAMAAARLILLATSLPVALAVGRADRHRSALRKWTSVLRWSLGLERWVRNYDPPSTDSASALSPATVRQ